MKLTDLYKIKSLRVEIARLNSKALEAKEKAEKTTASFSLIPGGGSSGGCRLENAALDEIDYKARAEKLSLELEALLSAIYGCNDYLIKNALIERYDIRPEDERQSWKIIALDLGTTADSLRMACKRYIENL